MSSLSGEDLPMDKKVSVSRTEHNYREQLHIAVPVLCTDVYNIVGYSASTEGFQSGRLRSYLTIAR